MLANYKYTCNCRKKKKKKKQTSPIVGSPVLADFKPENIIKYEPVENENAQTGEDLNMDTEPENTKSNYVANQSFNIFKERSRVRIDNVKCRRGRPKGAKNHFRTFLLQNLQRNEKQFVT